MSRRGARMNGGHRGLFRAAAAPRTAGRRGGADRPPVLLVHGDADEVVPPQSLPQAAEALQEAGWKDVLCPCHEGHRPRHRARRAERGAGLHAPTSWGFEREILDADRHRNNRGAGRRVREGPPRHSQDGRGDVGRDGLHHVRLLGRIRTGRIACGSTRNGRGARRWMRISPLRTWRNSASRWPMSGP